MIELLVTIIILIGFYSLYCNIAYCSKIRGLENTNAMKDERIDELLEELANFE